MKFTRLSLIMAVAMVVIAISVIATAQEDSVCEARLPDFKETSRERPCIQLIQQCGNCTFVNLTFIDYPDNTFRALNIPMQRNGSTFNATLCTVQIGEHIYGTIGNPNGENDPQAVCFKVKAGNSNLKLDLTNPIQLTVWIIILIIGIGIVLLASGTLGGIVIVLDGLILLFSTDNYIYSFIIVAVGVLCVAKDYQK